MTRLEWFLALGAVLIALGSVRMLLDSDPVRRVVAVNVAGSGVFVILVALAARTDPPDPVLHALVLTGIVIAVSVTGLALVLIRQTRPPSPGDGPADESDTEDPA
ncbi:NADH-quinone oxidoreductase subunit K [Mycobacterium sp. SMC-4]|uniref:NADH-quinone oxidoreductase subunit K n=1 Tax=Mycobacterium sp. SMC-4 TaxID=2857059 RepID=UPI0021B379BD|nr:NADH-quinone oxidoreductase subunit K [Mycobacterium sp. SMC-4]UXA18600.1 NADH-quinone oxidoreductase subunit K [Mycobacterium sp. SMC-4]